MGARGPARTPTAKLKLRGSWLAAEREKTEPQFTLGVGDPPVKLDADGMDEWNRAVAELSPTNVLTMADRGALAAHCEGWSYYRKLQGELKRCKRAADNLPLGYAAKAARSEYLKSCQQFGLTPASRSRVEAGERKADATSKLSKFRTA